jgi:hypothetical protein
VPMPDDSPRLLVSGTSGFGQVTHKGLDLAEAGEILHAIPSGG